MCSRYQFLPGSSNLLQTIAARAGGWSGGEVSPGTDSPVLVAEGAKIRVCLQNWGIPVINGKRAINARAETVCERPLFQASILHHRCVVPTTGFYEWDGQKHRYLFRLAQQPAVYLAGLYTEEGQIRHFAVLTTAPNASVRDIHDRMPLVLTQEQVRPWLMDTDFALRFLQKVPPLLEHTCEDGQLSFWL